MSEKTESKSENKGLLARTATYTSKKARRAQTKLKQRVGKGDETKDEVFDEFVLNFNKQQASALRLHTELKNYMRCITAMQVAHTNFGEAVKEVYEDDWTSRAKLVCHFNDFDNCWTNLRQRISEDVLEPLTSYLKPFPDVKTKINKRARKLVDYDHSRHAVDTLRAKGANKSSETKKLHQAEDEYQKAKDVFIDLTSELYEELPALYDSRIGFYVSCFQSIFTLEEVFHRDAARLNHDLNDLMDQLITDFSAGTFSTRKPFSAGLETSLNTSDKENNDTKLSSGSLAQFYDVAVPDEEDYIGSDNQQISPTSTLDDVDGIGKPVPATQNSEDNSVPSQPVRPAPTPPSNPEQLCTSPDRPKQPELFLTQAENTGEQEAFPSSQLEGNPQTQESSDESKEVVVTDNPSPLVASKNVVAYKNQPTAENPCNLIVPDALYKVIATFKYSPEDEDELSFEKGEIIHVIPYEDPEDQDEGWLLGVKDSDGGLGVFPENFSRRLP